MGGVESPPVLGDAIAYYCDETTVYAYDLDRSETRWTLDLDHPTSTSPALQGRTLFVTTIRGTVAIDRTDGSVFWRTDTGWGTSPSRSPVVSEGMLYEVGPRLVALDARTGDEQWRTDHIGANGVAVADGVYVTGGDSDAGTVARYARDGDRRWQTTVPEAVHAAPAVANGSVYLAGYERTLYSFDATGGSQQWATPIPGAVDAPPAVSDDVVVVGSGNGSNLTAADATTGAVRWRTAVEPSTNSLAIVDDAVVASDGSGTVHVLDLATGDRRRSWSTELPGGDVAVGDGVVASSSILTSEVAVIR